MPDQDTPQPDQVVDADVLLEIARDFEHHREQREETWYGYSDGDHWGAIPFVPALYRGQNKRHAPMLPSIARGLETSSGRLHEMSVGDQAKVVIRLAQSWWFGQELDRHPITSHATSQKLILNRMALAQHYGLPTGYLDLTDDFNVSAFFATCREGSSGWEPLDKGIGIIYRVVLKSLDNPFGEYRPVGPQLLPRPTEQCAWIAELPMIHAFDGWPDVMTMQFRHKRSAGEYFLKKFDGGKGLFPPDPLADVAKDILACREVPAALIDRAITSFAGDPLGIHADQIQDIRKEVAKMVTLIDYRAILRDEQVSSLMDDFEWRKKMLSEVKVNWRLVRDGPPAE